MIKIAEVSSFSHSRDDLKSNEDCILPPIAIDGGYLFAIADGVGSYFGAKEASQAAIEVVRKVANQQDFEHIESLFFRIRDAVQDLVHLDKAFASAATTLTFCYLNDEVIKIGHIGDCRAYIKSGNKLIQLTEDHTHYQKLVNEKVLSKKELKQTNVKHVLTTAISRHVLMNYDFFELPLDDIDDGSDSFSVYLMSDGAHGFWSKRPRFSDSTMNSVTKFSSSLLRRIERLHPVDDYSMVAVRFDREARLHETVDSKLSSIDVPTSA